MNVLYKFNKPEYIFKPSQLIKRILKIGMSRTHSKMPWGEVLHYNPNEDIGKAINVLGVYELPLTELLSRCLKDVEYFLDIGANIGYYSSLAASMDSIKEVQSFEPHPVIFETLKKNCNFSNKVILHKWAASSAKGEAILYIPKDFDSNMGIATLEESKDETMDEIKIETKTLDSTIDKTKSYCVKIDTEGHEARVLQGSKELLESGSLRYIFFEEFNAYPAAETFKILKEHNYDIYRIERELFGPKLVDPNIRDKKKRWQPVNFFAIKKEDPSINKIQGNRWDILKL